MKKALILCGIVAAFLCLAQNASAQYAKSIERKGANLVDNRGNILSDTEVRNLVGEQIFSETYLGAKKQAAIGRKLVSGGIAGSVVGVGAVFGGSYLIAKNSHIEGTGENQKLVYDDKQKAQLGAILFAGGAIMAGLSGTALSIGIPFSIVGKSRLNWVADNYNAGSDITYHIGATPNGVGLALQF